MNSLILKTRDYSKASFLDFYDKFKQALSLNETSERYNILTRDTDDSTLTERSIFSDLVLALCPKSLALAALGRSILGIECISESEFANRQGFISAAASYCLENKHIGKYRDFFADKKLIVAGAGQRSSKMTHIDFFKVWHTLWIQPTKNKEQDCLTNPCILLNSY